MVVMSGIILRFRKERMLKIKLILYFIIGALLDILATIDVRAIQKGQAAKSSIVSFINTMISYLVFYYILRSPEYLFETFAFALGGSVGAYYIIKKHYA